MASGRLAGDQIEDIFYYPYGETQTNAGSANVKYKYTGKELDSEDGLYYYGARYYDPKLARFISADTIVPLPFYPVSLNRYAYAYNNPIILKDLDGHQTGGENNSAGDTSGSTTTNDSYYGMPWWWFLFPAPTNYYQPISAPIILSNYSNSQANNSPLNNAVDWGAGASSGNKNNVSYDSSGYFDLSNSSAVCEGQARVLEGNPKLIGIQGGFPGVKVEDESAAIIPKQFGISAKSELQPYLDQIKGYVNGKELFNGVTDVIGNKVSPIKGMNVRDALQVRFPGVFIVEVVGSKDLNIVPITVVVPVCLQCPQGTVRKEP